MNGPFDLDTVPQKVKELFFCDKQMPSMEKDYDVIGFDADHCLVKYNLNALMTHISQILAEDLHENGYPHQILEWDPADLAFCMNNAVFDIMRGNLLKLVEGKVVAKAFHGRRALSPSEIQHEYGSPPVFGALNYPSEIRSLNAKDAHFVLMTYFECSKIPVIIQAVELIDSGELRKTYIQFAHDFFRAVVRQYGHYTDKEVFPISDYQRFFPEIVKNPATYIKAQPELRIYLEQLVAMGKRLFVATNSHEEYAHLILTQTLGPGWDSIIDLTVANSKKPNFFMSKVAPFYAVDQSAKTKKGKVISSAKEIDCSIVLEGNSKMLEEYFQQRLKTDNLRIAFFGDHYLGDVHFASICASNPSVTWHPFAVIEELALFDDRLNLGEPDFVHTPRWGSDYFQDVDCDGKLRKNYFVNEAARVSRYALPFVQNMCLFK